LLVLPRASLAAQVIGNKYEKYMRMLDDDEETGEPAS
tara:strand:+ start:316 stop:426 length:111 start_codon:yes stop_codon:yes gene_type:complete